MRWNAVYGVRIFTPHENHVVVSLVKAVKGDFLFGIKVLYACIIFLGAYFYRVSHRPASKSAA